MTLEPGSEVRSPRQRARQLALWDTDSPDVVHEFAQQQETPALGEGEPAHARLSADHVADVEGKRPPARNLPPPGECTGSARSRALTLAIQRPPGANGLVR